MAMQSFTRNFDDNSTEAGFEFEFRCDKCGDGVKSRFIESKTYRKGCMFKSITEGISTGARLFGLNNIAYGLERGSDIVGRSFDGMSPEWHKEHEYAFQQAVNEAKSHFHRCHGCTTYVCDSDYNEEEGMCVDCAPREHTAVSKARSARMVEEINESFSQSI